MGKLEDMKRASRLIGKTGKIFQILFGILAGIFLISILVLSALRNTLSTMPAASLTGFDFSHMGYFAGKLADEGRFVDACIVFLIFSVLFSLMVTVIMYFIARIFNKIYRDYSPFLPEIVKDLKVVSVLSTLLILQSSIGFGIIAGFIFWGIIRLYEYGCELQNQADETL